MTKATREQLLELLHKHVSQRSGISWQDYGGDRDAFMSDYRPMLQEGRDARAMLHAIASRNSITADMIAAGFSAFSGRLALIERNGVPALEYTTGQYFPTEYRAAACAVCASILWNYWMECGTSHHKPEAGDSRDDTIRKQARNELGRGIASRWFK